MKYKLLVLLLMFSVDSNASWTQLNYNTPSECFASGVKRVFIPFPGIGTFACLKDAAKQLPEYENSFQLLAGHATGLFASGCIAMVTLILGLQLDIPGCREILGPELAQFFKIKSQELSCN